MEGRSKTKKLLKPKLKTTLHNAFAILSQPNDPANIYYMSESISLHDDDKTIMPTDRKEHRLKQRAARRQHFKLTLQRLKDSEELFFDNSITQAEDERTTMAKNNNKKARRIAIDAAHDAKQDKPRIGMVQQGRNTAYTFGSALKRQFKRITKSKHVSFAKQHTMRQIDENITCVMVDYDSGADGNYISEEDRRKAGLPILRASPKTVGVAKQWWQEQGHICHTITFPKAISKGK